MRTRLLDKLAFFKSAWQRSGPYYVEPREHTAAQRAKKLLIRHPAWADSLLTECPSLTKDGLASLIETRLCSDGSAASFATPYIALPQAINPENHELEIYAYPPITHTPHVFCTAGQKGYDFSQLVFEVRALLPFLKEQGIEIPLPPSQPDCQEKVDKTKFSRENWQASIKNCTELLNELHNGVIAPMTREQTKELLDKRGICLNEPFNAWWACVPDKLKKKSQHSHKKESGKVYG